MNRDTYITTLLPLIACFFMMPLFAGNIEESARNELQIQLDNIQPFQSSYQQILRDKNDNVIEESRGNFYLGKSKRFKNVIEYPEHSAMISDGKKLWMIDYELEQVSINFLVDYLEGSPLSLLLGDSQKSLVEFAIKKSKNAALKQSLYQLKSLDEMASISGLRLGFKGESILYIEIDERSGNKVRVNFSKNIKLKNPKESFEASFPKEFDVVDET